MASATIPRTKCGLSVSNQLDAGSYNNQPSCASVELPHGIQRHRIMWVRKLDKAEARQIVQGGATIDKIDVAEFEQAPPVQAS
jgi:hypothetical protein